MTVLWIIYAVGAIVLWLPFSWAFLWSIKPGAGEVSVGDGIASFVMGAIMSFIWPVFAAVVIAAAVMGGIFYYPAKLLTRKFNASRDESTDD